MSDSKTLHLTITVDGKTISLEIGSGDTNDLASDLTKRIAKNSKKGFAKKRLEPVGQADGNPFAEGIIRPRPS